jgi:hypothetical protein
MAMKMPFFKDGLSARSRSGIVIPSERENLYQGRIANITKTASQ